jgi:hypothetical protein
MAASVSASGRPHGRGGSRRAMSAAWAAVLAGAAALWGCAPQTMLPLPPVGRERPLSLDEAKQQLLLRATEWSTLVARCRLTVRSRRLPTANKQVTFGEGSLRVQRARGTPPKVNLRVPDKANPQVLLVGDGTRYLVDMPVFGVQHRGSYGEPLPPETLRLCLWPDDLADALQPGRLFLDHAQFLRQDMVGYWVDSITWELEPAKVMYIASSVRVSSGQGATMNAIKYNRDGSIRAVVVCPVGQPVETADGSTVEVPAVVTIAYPGRDAAFMLELADVEVEAGIPADAFDLGS